MAFVKVVFELTPFILSFCFLLFGLSPPLPGFTLQSKRVLSKSEIAEQFVGRESSNGCGDNGHDLCGKGETDDVSFFKLKFHIIPNRYKHTISS